MSDTTDEKFEEWAEVLNSYSLRWLRDRFNTIEDIFQHSYGEVSTMPGCGPATLRDLASLARLLSLSWGPEDDAATSVRINEGSEPEPIVDPVLTVRRRARRPFSLAGSYHRRPTHKLPE